MIASESLGLDAKARHLIAAAVAHARQRPDCVRVHTSDARRKGATEEEIVEAIGIATELDPGRPRPLEARDDASIELDHYE